MSSLDDVVAAERRLLDPAVRADPVAVAELLHPEFVEIGASGARWDRAGIIGALAASPASDAEMREVVPLALGEGAVLLTYLAETRSLPRQRSRRSSLWVLHEGRWRMRYHQGTAVA